MEKKIWYALNLNGIFAADETATTKCERNAWVFECKDDAAQINDLNFNNKYEIVEVEVIICKKINKMRRGLNSAPCCF